MWHPMTLLLSNTLLVGWLTTAVAAPAVAEKDVDPDSGLARWTLNAGALSLQLIQRLPDQTRAFFQGRGFPAEPADELAVACVFQAIVRNAGEPPGPALGIDLARWQVDQGEGLQPLPLEREWQPRWEAAGVSQAARIAFRWALFPTEQSFQPGDYNWGMIPFGPAPGKPFDLSLVWSEDGVERSARITGIRCAADE